MFLRNARYVAAVQSELGKSFYPSAILGEQIVLSRRADGIPAALEDAHPHRRMTLSLGRKLGDQIDCGHRCLTFDRTGSCVRAPGDTRRCS